MTPATAVRHQPPAAAARPAAQPQRRAAAVNETTAFRAAMAVVVLAVLDDAFVHPEPSVAASDHVVSGLVPAALGVALAILYPRLRAGARTFIALASGALAARPADYDRRVIGFFDRSVR